MARQAGFPAGRLSARRALTGTVGTGPEALPSCACFIDPALAGRGFATEAMKALPADAIPRFAVTEIVADHFADNPASGRVLVKPGFVKTGTGTGTSGARDGLAPLELYRRSKGD